MQVEIDYEDWHAVHDLMAKELHVTGVCKVQGGGFAATLEAHEGEPLFNPLMLSLDLVITPTAETPSRVEVEWHQPWTEDGLQYTEVGFRVRPVEAEAPPALEIEEVH